MAVAAERISSAPGRGSVSRSGSYSWASADVALANKSKREVGHTPFETTGESPGSHKPRPLQTV